MKEIEEMKQDYFEKKERYDQRIDLKEKEIKTKELSLQSEFAKKIQDR